MTLILMATIFTDQLMSISDETLTSAWSSLYYPYYQYHWDVIYQSFSYSIKHPIISSTSAHLCIRWINSVWRVCLCVGIHIYSLCVYVCVCLWGQACVRLTMLTCSGSEPGLSSLLLLQLPEPPDRRRTDDDDWPMSGIQTHADRRSI